MAQQSVPVFREPRVLSVYDRRIAFETDEVASNLYTIARQWTRNDPVSVLHANQQRDQVPPISGDAREEEKRQRQSFPDDIDPVTGILQVQFKLPTMQSSAVSVPARLEPEQGTATVEEILPKPVAKLSKEEEELHRRQLRDYHVDYHQQVRNWLRSAHRARTQGHAQRLAILAPHIFGPDSLPAQGVSMPTLRMGAGVRTRASMHAPMQMPVPHRLQGSSLISEHRYGASALDDAAVMMSWEGSKSHVGRSHGQVVGQQEDEPGLQHGVQTSHAESLRHPSSAALHARQRAHVSSDAHAPLGTHAEEEDGASQFLAMWGSALDQRGGAGGTAEGLGPPEQSNEVPTIETTAEHEHVHEGGEGDRHADRHFNTRLAPDVEMAGTPGVRGRRHLGGLESVTSPAALPQLAELLAGFAHGQ